MTRSNFIVTFVKPAMFAALLLPVLALGVMDLGANPVETITHHTGDWALRLLLVTLAVTPLRKLTGWGELIRLRRMLGLYAFFYALLHVATYFVLDLELHLGGLVDDVIKRPYITVGFSVFLMLLLMAATSTNAMVRRLGRRWKTLHKLVYPAAIGAVLHFVWLVKADLREPLLYALVLLVLFALRLKPAALYLRRRRCNEST